MIKRMLSIFSDSSGSFQGQEPDERVILLLRHHPFNIFVKISLAGGAALLPVLIGIVAWPDITEKGLASVFFFLASVWYMILWLGVFYSLTMYSLDTMIVTNHRIIDNDQHGFFNRHVAELPISKIQDIAVHTHGVMATFFKFGNVVIQTASSEPRLTFPHIPDPERVKDVIMKQLRNHTSDIHQP